MRGRSHATRDVPGQARPVRDAIGPRTTYGCLAAPVGIRIAFTDSQRGRIVSLAAIPFRPSAAPPGHPRESFQTGRLERMGRPIRVVIAEDEAVFALDIQNMIEKAGGEVAGIVVRGQDAITLAAALKPDVVLMDVHLLGEMDGLEAARAIKAWRDIAVVFVTAHGDPDTLRRMFEVVPSAPVLKPISEVQLREAIVRACHR